MILYEWKGSLNNESIMINIIYTITGWEENSKFVNGTVFSLFFTQKTCKSTGFPNSSVSIDTSLDQRNTQ
jgi:hypothetical protein